MFHKQDHQAQTAFILATLDDLVPQDHYLRDIATYVDFDFIYDLVARPFMIQRMVAPA